MDFLHWFHGIPYHEGVSLADGFEERRSVKQKNCDHCGPKGWRFIPEADTFIPCCRCNPNNKRGFTKPSPNP